MYEDEEGDDLLKELEREKVSPQNDEDSRPRSAVRIVIDDDDENEDIGKIKSMYEPNQDFDLNDFEPISTVKAQPSLSLERMRPRKVLISGSVKENDENFSSLRWNAYGHVFSKTIDGENNLEIVFRDALVHEEIVMENNSNRYIFADLNNKLFALASKKNEKGLSELYVRHIGAWDRDCALWTTTMPVDERITSVAVGDNFVVLSTDLRNVRIYTSTGLFRFVFTVEGPIRSLIAGVDRFAIIRSTGGLIVADTGDECEHRYCVDVFKANVLSTSPVVREKTVPLAVTPGSEINWAQITPNGQVCTMDDVFVVRYLTPSGLWIPVFNGGEVLKTMDRDAIWPISLTEKPTPTFRYLYCKGRLTPNFHRVEVPLSSPWSLPIENKETEKGKLEHELALSELVLSLAKTQAVGGMSSELSTLLQEHSKTLIKYFALCCKKERDTRAFDLAHMSTNTQNLQLMCNYASKQNRILLSSKITALGQERSEQSYSHATDYEQTAVSHSSQTLTIQQPQKRIQVQKRRQVNTISTLSFDGREEAAEDSLFLNSSRLLNESMSSIGDTVDSMAADSTSRLTAKENTPNMRKRLLDGDHNPEAATKQRKSGNDDFFDSLI